MTGGASSRQVVEADLVWTGERFETGVGVTIGPDGRIVAVGRVDGAADVRLPGRALVPGLVSAHSHAFQRGLRGSGEAFPRGAGDFWSWREAMYGLVEALDGDRFAELSARAFREMRDAGITAVGEFHYLRHSPTADDWALDRRILEAAAEAGIRIALLPAYYRTGDVGRPLAGAQRRFATPSPEAYWERLDALAGALDPRTQSLGAAAHSVRAATPDEIAKLRREAARRRLPFHLHLEERRREVEACRAAYGGTPASVLLEAFGDDAGNVTAVHCTQTVPADLERLLAAGGRVCVCPLTEANLGDGIPDLAPAAGVPGRLCLGTDSNARIDPVEEMRWLEYGQRLGRGKRGALVDGSGRVAPRLLSIAAEGGAAALSIEAGRIETGRWADLAALDLGHPALAGAEPDALAAAWIFGAGGDAVAATCVAGRWRETGAEG